MDRDERRRQARLATLAFDMRLEEFGQAEWQRARRDEPSKFWRAKIQIETGPDGMTCTVERALRAESEWRFSFEWKRDGRREQINHLVRHRDLFDDDSLGPPDMFLAAAMRQVGRQIQHHTGIPTTISVRGNRAAHEEMRRQEEPRPGEVPFADLYRRTR